MTAAWGARCGSGGSASAPLPRRRQGSPSLSRAPAARPGAESGGKGRPGCPDELAERSAHTPFAGTQIFPRGLLGSSNANSPASLTIPFPQAVLEKSDSLPPEASTREKEAKAVCGLQAGRS